nr:MAG: replication associated protein [Cressdnaviricota sp.]
MDLIDTPKGIKVGDEKKEAKTTPKFKRWCFANFGGKPPSDECIDIPCWYNLVTFSKTKMWYLVFQQEMCPKTNRLHMQGYVEMKEAYTMIQMKQFSSSARWDACNGNRESNEYYCTKSRTSVCGPFKFGRWRSDAEEASKTKVEAVWHMVSEGYSPKKIFDNYPSIAIQYGPRIRFECDKIPKKRPDWKKKLVYWYWGKTRTGKSYKAKMENGYYNDPSEAYIHVDKTCKNFDKYKGEKCTIFDDMTPCNRMDIGEFLTLTDGDALDKNVKYDFINYQPDKIIFTSNWHWSKVFGVNPEHPNYYAIKERFTEVIEMNERFTPKK